MADINTLLGMNLGPEADMQALADQLRGKQREGQFFSGSTLAPVAQYGQTLQSNARDSATRGGALRQTMAKERQAQENYNATALAKTQAAKKLADEKASVRSTESYWHPTQKDTVLNLREGPDGQHYDQQGQVYDPQLLTPYRAPTATGSSQKLSKAEVKERNQKDKKVSGRDFVSSRMKSPHMAGAMGSTVNIGSMLPDAIGINPKVGSLQDDLSGMTVQQAADPLSYLGVNPTDKDLSFALEATRNLGSQPESWRDWYRDIYTPEIEKAINSDSVLTDVEKQDAINSWREMAKDTIDEMNKNISLESGKGVFQRFKETFNEDATEAYKDQSGGSKQIDDLVTKYGG